MFHMSFRIHDLFLPVLDTAVINYMELGKDEMCYNLQTGTILLILIGANVFFFLFSLVEAYIKWSRNFKWTL